MTPSPVAVHAILHRRSAVLLAAASVVVACLIWVPGSTLDRSTMTLVARAQANPPWQIIGSGQRSDPWQMRSLAADAHINPTMIPAVVSFGDDHEGVFQASPPAPIDLAVILKNFHRFGSRRAAIAVVMAWEQPDPMGLAALDQVIRQFDSLVMAAPLSRGPVADPIPSAFRRASLPINAVMGNPEHLPAVNRIPIPGIILGVSDNTYASFSVLESESQGQRMPLLARWDDRIIFAFPLLATVQRLRIPADQVEVRLGEFIRLGPNGPLVPIDSFGRLAAKIPANVRSPEIAAAAMIDAPADLALFRSGPPTLLRDDRSAAEAGTREFSKSVVPLVAMFASDACWSPARAFQRWPMLPEILVLATWVLVLASLSTLPAWTMHISYLGLGLAAAACQMIAAASASLWLPGIAAITAAVVAAIVARVLPLPPADPTESRSLIYPPPRISDPLPPHRSADDPPPSITTPPKLHPDH